MRIFTLFSYAYGAFSYAKISPGPPGGKFGSGLFLIAGTWLIAATVAAAPGDNSPDQILLKDYRPKSIFNIPETAVEKARYPIIDVHSHNYARLDECPNLYADMGARFAEISPIPRFVTAFFKRYSDRLMYGTDMDPQPGMYRVTFRYLETADEHFYPGYFSKYHWPWHALALPDDILKKVYRENALRVCGN